MKYDFTSILDRKGKDAIAVDNIGPTGWGPEGPKEGFDAIPMWVADMNFPVLPAIQEAMVQRINHPTFGYFMPRQEYFALTSKGAVVISFTSNVKKCECESSKPEKKDSVVGIFPID